LNGNGKKDDVWSMKDYRCRARLIGIVAGGNIIVLNEQEAMAHDIYPSHRVILRCRGKEIIAKVDLSSDIVGFGEIGLFTEIAKELKASESEIIDVKHMARPASLQYVKDKIEGKELNAEQIEVVIDDLMENKLSEPELAAFIAAMHIRGLTHNEIIALTNSIVKSGDVLNLGKSPIMDKHCVGGVAGNRTTMLLVPIVAAAGLYIPKTSSRSITSAAGTADTMEVLAPVTFELEEMRKIVLKTNGCIAWGGAMNLAAADDKLIKIRHPLSLDPRGVLLASILAKKKSVGAQYAVIDIPIGRGAKIMDTAAAQALGNDFISLGKKLGIVIEVLITDGSDPIGNGVGPGLECRDVFEVLEGGGPMDLRDKSCLLAGTMLEMCGKVEKGRGYTAASEIIKSGKALVKFREIIAMQGGNSKVKSSDLPIGQCVHKVIAQKTGRISHVDNKMISNVARAAGAPLDRGAGVYLHCEMGDKVVAGDTLFEIYAESESKLDFALKALEVWEPVELQKVVLGNLK